MKISLKNIGKIKSASVEINGITVIAGENVPAKVLLGRHFIVYFLPSITLMIKLTKKESSLFTGFFLVLSGDGEIWELPMIQSISKEICENKDYYIGNPEELNKRLSDIYRDNGINDIGELEKLNDQILQYLKLDEEHIKANVLKHVLQSEFNMQIGHVNFRGNVQFDHTGSS